MKKVIIGAGNKTRLLLDFLLQEGRVGEILGIVDRNAALHGNTFYGCRVLGSLNDLLGAGRLPMHTFCISLGESYFADRAQILTQLRERGCEISSIVSARAHVSSSAMVAPGAILFPDVTVGTSANVGCCVTAFTGALLEHDCIVQENVEISPRAVLAGGCVVRSGAFIGIGATVFPRITVGESSVVGGCAVVTRDVLPRTTVAGNPARILREASP